MRRLFLAGLLFILLAGCSGDSSKPAALKPDEDYTRPINLSDYKGKVVLLDFWATWCPPCRRILPHEKELVKRLEGKPFVMIGISADHTLAELKEFDSSEQLPWRNFWDADHNMLGKWKVKAFPTMIVLDHEGKEVRRIVGADKDELDEAIDEALKKVPVLGRPPA